MKRSHTIPILGALAGLLTLGPVAADVVFTADFEGFGNTDDDTLATYDKYPPTPTDWVAANQGYGATSAGLNLVGTNTVYSFRYTNSGLTTAAGVIGTFGAGQTITVTFDVSQDNGGAAPYSVSLVTFNGAARNDVRSNTGATGTLASATGSAGASGDTIVLTYTDDGTYSGLYGQDLVIRIFGASTSANYDNFSVDLVAPVDNVAPEPNPMTFDVAPAAVSATSISMTATAAIDSTPPVEYRFVNVTNTTDSGWIPSKSWTDTGLTQFVNYEYQVQARDSLGNTGTLSASAFAVADVDTTPPTPNPMTFAVAPQPTVAGTITMTATEAIDAYGSNPVEYLFENVTNTTDSGWITDTTYTETGLTEGASYGYRVTARDALENTGTASGTVNATVEDLVAPSPVSFAVGPKPASATSITMTATTSTDAYPSNPVEYYFENTTLATNSGWSTSQTWVDTGLTEGNTYDYQVKARDAAGNETGFSGTASAVPAPDDAAPNPNPMTFAIAPYPSATGAISMTATTANDAYGSTPVEYFFENTTTSNNSGWTTSNTWTEIGLTDGVSYDYHVKARDAALNETAFSDLASATSGTVNTVFFDDFENGANDATVDQSTGGYSQTPDVDTYTVANTSRQYNTTLWVDSTQGFGSDKQGLIDDLGADAGNFTDPTGQQAYGFRYTNSGLTTAEGVIGSLTAGATYVVTFDVVLDGYNSGSAYNVALVTFNGAARNDVRNNTGATSTLASRSGSYSGTPYKTLTLVYTSDGTEAQLGQDVAFRVFGASNYGDIDNVQVRVATAGGGGPADPYGDWAATNAPGQTPEQDYDMDGVQNGVEMVLGGDKDTNDLDKLPVVSTDGTDMTFSFDRDQASIDPSITATIEVSTDLVTWDAASSPYAVPDGAATANPGVSVVKDTKPGFDTVTLTLPQAPDSKKFARLKVVVTTP